jgi:endoglucanase
MKCRLTIIIAMSFLLGFLTKPTEACDDLIYPTGNVSVAGPVIMRDGRPWIAKGATLVGLITSPRRYSQTKPAGVIASRRFGDDRLREIKQVLGGDTVRFQVHQSILDPKNINFDEAYIGSVIRPGVRMARQMGLSVILSMQHGWGLDEPGFKNHPTDTTYRAWEQLGPVFGCDAGVIYELYNEPMRERRGSDVWRTWVLQHQPIIDLLRRQGNINVLIADGPDQVLTGVESSGIIDPAGKLVFGTHPYPTINGQNNEPGKWFKNFGYLSGHYPVLLSEWVVASGTACREDLETFVVLFLQEIKNWGFGLLAWGVDTGTLIRGSSENPELTTYRGFRCSKESDGGPGKTLHHYYTTGDIILK